jgi:hypothetical protein
MVAQSGERLLENGQQFLRRGRVVSVAPLLLDALTLPLNALLGFLNVPTCHFHRCLGPAHLSLLAGRCTALPLEHRQFVLSKASTDTIRPSEKGREGGAARVSRLRSGPRSCATVE